MSHHLLHYLHLIAAAAWLGGTLLMALSTLPALWQKDGLAALPPALRVAERMHLAALALLLISGYGLAWHWLPDAASWFQSDLRQADLIQLKWLLLIGAAALSGWAHIYLLPTWTPARRLALSVYLLGNLLIALAMTWLGTRFRYDGLIG
jgi:putative copper export protein